jgi:ATP-dependent Clp protease ATP-binding subunit ClpC
MFERFTDRARRVVVLAQEEARRLDHNYIGTEHLLLGLIREGEGVASLALGSLGISLEAVRSQVEEIIGRGQAAPGGHIPFTPRAKKVLELSLREALQLGHDYIGTEHILLGLIREGEGVAAQVLQKMGGDLNRVRQQVIQLLEGHTGEKVERRPGEAAAGQAEGLARGTRLHQLALEEMRMMGDDVLGPEHLYLAQLAQEIEVAEGKRQELAAARRRMWRARQPPPEAASGVWGDAEDGEDEAPDEPAGEPPT